MQTEQREASQADTRELRSGKRELLNTVKVLAKGS